MSSRYGKLAVALFLAVSLALLGCGGEATSTGSSADAAAEATPEAAEPVPAAEIHAILAKADAVDGAADHVVTKCAGCALMMDGDAEHAIEVQDFEMHFCSGHCKEAFSENVDAALVAMTLPE